MQAVAGRIEAHVKLDLLGAQKFFDCFLIGLLVAEAARLQFLENVHRLCCFPFNVAPSPGGDKNFTIILFRRSATRRPEEKHGKPPPVG
ncbi:hypothetical protein SDC9_161432 [bioreactor metagenome]|uniref:Uncharacterized protein n=1 Tax=bioreactor metagenome TaxID=1076179 RepID=A0A645FKB6_9ZZZZ